MDLLQCFLKSGFWKQNLYHLVSRFSVSVSSDSLVWPGVWFSVREGKTFYDVSMCDNISESRRYWEHIESRLYENGWVAVRVTQSLPLYSVTLLQSLLGHLADGVTALWKLDLWGYFGGRIRAQCFALVRSPILGCRPPNGNSSFLCQPHTSQMSHRWTGWAEYNFHFLNDIFPLICQTSDFREICICFTDTRESMNACW